MGRRRGMKLLFEDLIGGMQCSEGTVGIRDREILNTSAWLGKIKYNPEWLKLREMLRDSETSRFLTSVFNLPS
jgi:hypothetical protein